MFISRRSALGDATYDVDAYYESAAQNIADTAASIQETAQLIAAQAEWKKQFRSQVLHVDAVRGMAKSVLDSLDKVRASSTRGEQLYAEALQKDSYKSLVDKIGEAVASTVVLMGSDVAKSVVDEEPDYYHIIAPKYDSARELLQRAMLGVDPGLEKYLNKEVTKYRIKAGIQRAPLQQAYVSVPEDSEEDIKAAIAEQGKKTISAADLAAIRQRLGIASRQQTKQALAPFYVPPTATPVVEEETVYIPEEPTFYDLVLDSMHDHPLLWGGAALGLIGGTVLLLRKGTNP